MTRAELSVSLRPPRTSSCKSYCTGLQTFRAVSDPNMVNRSCLGGMLSPGMARGTNGVNSVSLTCVMLTRESVSLG